MNVWTKSVDMRILSATNNSHDIFTLYQPIFEYK